MAAHVLPGLGLNGNFVDGQDNWGEQMDSNLELLTIAVNTSVLGAVAGSGDLPADAPDGAMYLQTNNGHIRSYDEADDEWMDTTPKNGWRLFRNDTLEFFNWIDGQWVPEDSGPSLPNGGTTGQVLAKASDDDGDAEWVDPTAAGLPAGTPGQVLVKTADGVAFEDFDGLPDDGELGQIIVFGADGPEWGDPSAAEEGGAWAVVNGANGALLAGQNCTVVRDTPSRYNVTFDEPRDDADYGVLFGGTSGAGGTQPFVVDGSQTVNGFSIICYNAGGGEAQPGRLMFQLAGLAPGGEGGGGGGGGIEDAPSDGTPYARQDAAWIEAVGEAPVDGDSYVRKDGAWVPVAAPAPASAMTKTEAGTAVNLDAADVGKYQRFTATSAKTLAVRPNSIHALPTDGEWHVRNVGATELTIVAGAGVTIAVPANGTLVVPVAGTVTLKRVAADTFDLFGVTVVA